MHVQSRPGEGSTFQVYVPAEDEQAPAEGVAQADRPFRGDGETILFVDDERAMRSTASAVLEGLGLTPVTATDGADALMQVAEHRTAIRAVITDLHMPDMDGLALAKALRRVLPDVPIAVASGSMDAKRRGEMRALGVHEQLDKPFTEQELAETLRTLLRPED